MKSRALATAAAVAAMLTTTACRDGAPQGTPGPVVATPTDTFQLRRLGPGDQLPDGLQPPDTVRAAGPTQGGDHQQQPGG